MKQSLVVEFYWSLRQLTVPSKSTQDRKHMSTAIRFVSTHKSSIDQTDGFTHSSSLTPYCAKLTADKLLKDIRIFWKNVLSEPICTFVHNLQFILGATFWKPPSFGKTSRTDPNSLYHQVFTDRSGCTLPNLC